jgi:hypothetical protein
MTFPWLVLAGWAVAGLIMSLVGHARTRLVLTEVTEPEE